MITADFTAKEKDNGTLLDITAQFNTANVAQLLPQNNPELKQGLTQSKKPLHSAVA